MIRIVVVRKGLKGSLRKSLAITCTLRALEQKHTRMLFSLTQHDDTPQLWMSRCSQHEPEILKCFAQRESGGVLHSCASAGKFVTSQLCSCAEEQKHAQNQEMAADPDLQVLARLRTVGYELDDNCHESGDHITFC